MPLLAHITATEIGVLGAVFAAGFLAARLGAMRFTTARNSKESASPK